VEVIRLDRDRRLVTLSRPSSYHGDKGMRTSVKYNKLLIERGVSLARMNVRDVGLRRDDALLAVEFLKDEEIPILGGEVWHGREGHFELSYANWYTDLNPREDQRTYSSRSCEAAEQYVRDFPKQVGIEQLFVLVIQRRE
jgi:hypothetical protein